MLGQVARALARRDWSGVLETTDDFVVYATDMELGNLAEGMRAGLTKDRLRRLRRRGWLPG